MKSKIWSISREHQINPIVAINQSIDCFTKQASHANHMKSNVRNKQKKKRKDQYSSRCVRKRTKTKHDKQQNTKKAMLVALAIEFVCVVHLESKAYFIRVWTSTPNMAMAFSFSSLAESACCWYCCNPRLTASASRSSTRTASGAEILHKEPSFTMANPPLTKNFLISLSFKWTETTPGWSSAIVPGALGRIPRF